MSLENLKSAFSNIEKFSQSDVTQMSSQHSILNEPQEVDYMDNQNAPGFSANQFQGNPSLFVGIEGTNWSSTTGFYNASNVDFPGPVDWLYNTHASGFTLDQVEGNDTLFVGVEDGGDFTNTSRYTVSNITVPGPVDWLGNDHASGFTLDQIAGNDTLFVGVEDGGDFTNTSRYTVSNITVPGPVNWMGDDHASGFTLDQVAANDTLFVGVEDGGDFTNTSMYSGVSWDNGEVTFLGNTYSFDNGLPAIDATTWTIPTNFTYQNSQYGVNAISDIFGEEWSYTNDIPSAGTTWNTGEESLTSYYDSIHTTNAISDTFGGPVDFMNGLNSYYTEVNSDVSPSGVPGFTTDWIIGGYSESGLGSSKYLNIETGTYSRPPYYGYDGNITFTDVLGETMTTHFGDVFTIGLNQNSSTLIGGIEDDGLSREWTPSTSYQDNIHSRNSTTLLDEFDINTFLESTRPGYYKIQSGEENINPSKGSNKGGQLSPQFDKLYNINQSAKDAKYMGPIQFDSQINEKDRFSIDSNLWTVNPNRVGGTAEIGIFKIAVEGVAELIPGNPLGQALSLGNKTEPYVTFEMGSDDQRWTDQYLPISRLQFDVQRIGKFLSSQKGEEFILQQNLMGTFQQYKALYDPGSTMLNVASPKEGLGTPMVNIARDVGAVGSIIDLIVPNTYTEWLDARGQGRNSLGLPSTQGTKTYAERELKHKPLAFAAGDALSGAADFVMGAMGFGGDSPTPKDPAGITMDSAVDSKNNMNADMDPTTSPLGSIGKGDSHTLKPIWIHNKEATITNKLEQWEGMPFYFKDLRDNAVIFFRAYINGLSDTISPNWSSENYIGRSEPVYTYTNSEREIQFNLSLFAQTKDELNQIYTKINRLTSLCYPEYHSEVAFKDGEVDEDATTTLRKKGSRIMMKPPLTKLRLGELFGAGGTKDMTGFIKSLSYTFPDESPWEIQDGYRVPKYITVDIGFQVIHSTVPSLDFARVEDSEGNPTLGNTFYGINQTLVPKTKSDGTIGRNDAVGF